MNIQRLISCCDFIDIQNCYKKILGTKDAPGLTKSLIKNDIISNDNLENVNLRDSLTAAEYISKLFVINFTEFKKMIDKEYAGNLFNDLNTSLSKLI